MVDQNQKFNMSVEENVFYAKRNLVDTIWKEANIEGIGVTFPDTKEVFEGRTVPGLSVDDTVKINNLKHAWQFLLDTLDVPLDIPYIRQMHGYVGAGIISAAGELRDGGVTIGGTDCKPEIPDLDVAKAVIEKINSLENAQERALEAFAWLCRAQLFYDGNKRTAQLVANKVLIENGAGILAIPVKEKRQFETLLVDFYETNDPSALKDFLVGTSLNGIDRPLGRAKTIEELATRGTAKAEERNNALKGNDNPTHGNRGR